MVWILSSQKMARVLEKFEDENECPTLVVAGLIRKRAKEMTFQTGADSRMGSELLTC